MKPGEADSLPDIIAPSLRVLFCGINPATTAAQAGRHFVSRTNRFWRVLYLSGLTPLEIQAADDHSILEYGFGLTTLITRPTAGIAELGRNDYGAARDTFEQKVRSNRPEILAFLGKSAWSSLAGTTSISWGPQQPLYAGARVWVLPNPSGRNLHFTLDELVRHYRDLQEDWIAPGQGPQS